MSLRPDAKTPLILALDIGTSGPRALLYDRYGQAVAGMASKQPLLFEVSPDGGVVADADLILDGVMRCLDQILELAGDLADNIMGVSACTFVSNLLGVDEHFRAITPVYTYADTRPAAESWALRQEYDEEAFHQRTGCYFHPSYLPARFLWLERTQPETFQHCWRWVSIGEYLFLKLFGEARLSYSAASWTGMLDRRKLAWDDETLSLSHVPAERFSPLGDFDQPMQGLLPEYARRWRALSGIPWFPAVGDGAAANIGSGCIQPTQVAISLANTCAVRLVLEGDIKSVPPGLWCYRVDRRRSLLGGALTEGGNFINWLRRLLNLEGMENPEDSLIGRMPGAHGLTFLPLVAGERSPGWNPAARGLATGMTLATTPLDIFQAGLEGVICRIAQVYQLLGDVLPGEPQVIASGGAATHSRFLVASLADALGRPVRISQVEEASARGAALLALEALGLIESLEKVTFPVSEPFTPDAARHRCYQEMIQEQRRCYHRNFEP